MRRLLMSSIGRGAFTAPPEPVALVASGPYDPALTIADTILTQVHCHTNQSDGSYSPGAVVADYAGAGYGALILTDHDKVSSQPAGVNIPISGVELSPTTGHVIAMGSTYSRGMTTDIQTILNGVASNGGVAELAHPKWSRGHSYAAMQTLTGWSGLEIHNTHCVPGAGQNAVSYPGYAIDRWDQVLAGIRRDAWGYAVDDLHVIGQYTTYDVGRIQVFAETADAAGVMAGIASGNFVADVSNYGVTPGVPDRSNEGVYLSCAGATRIEAWGAAGLLSSAAGTSLSHAFSVADPYVRLVAVGDYSEPFSSALSNRWVVIDGTWTVSGGKLVLSSTSSVRRIILRRHRMGDFSARFDVTPSASGDTAALMFQVLNNTSYYIVRLGPAPTLTSWHNRLAIGKTTSDNFSNTVIAGTDYPMSAGTTYRVALDYAAATGTHRAKVWRPGTDAEPDWMISGVDLTWGHGAFGLRASGAPSFDDLYIDGFRTYYQPIAVDAA